MSCARLALLAAVLIQSAIHVAALAQTPPHHPLAIVAELDGIIHPVSAEYLTGVIDQADTSGADVVVIVLRTPGGLLDSTRDIVTRMINSRAPVVVFVGPAGGRAASAGFILTLAADVAAMAPGTHIGAAHPVSGNGQAMDSVMSQKAAADAAAYARTLAEARGRNVMLAEAAVNESRAFTDEEALKATPPLIDFLATDVDDLLRKLDGRTIKRFDGRMTMIHTQGVETRRVEMTRRQTFLSALAHPEVAYLLMTLGMIGLTVELWNPGAVLPGVAGALSLLLAFFALQIIPINTTGLLLILLGIGLLVLELKVPSGVLGVGGTIALVIGSVMMTGSVPGVRVGFGFIIPAAIAFSAIFLFLGRLALQSQRRPAVSGQEGLIGAQGRARDPLTPDASGYVQVRGELWRATSVRPVAPGQPIRVLDINGLTLTVEPITGSGPAEAGHSQPGTHGESS
jgi:membrane-bound serine protease (ClpP class)